MHSDILVLNYIYSVCFKADYISCSILHLLFFNLVVYTLNTTRTITLKIFLSTLKLRGKISMFRKVALYVLFVVFEFAMLIENLSPIVIIFVYL